ncbi:MAG: HD domain-containing protein [Candidatus Omnitrophica bacterium]|nr:HD domain-containing protein [Candidatus Omnitrophota bacterium]
MKRKRKKLSVNAIANFISEAGLLKRTKRSGWSVLGIKDAESVADHSFRCAVIGFFLAQTEKASTYKVLLMTLFNDIHEARIGDLHKMAQRYIDSEKAEDKSFDEQVSALPGGIKKVLKGVRKEYKAQNTKESIIARDADILECLIQAKEYQDYGYCRASQFMKKAPKFLKTKSAKELWKRVKKANSDNWWLKLSEFKR